MNQRKGFIGGIILILLGGFFLAQQLLPDTFGTFSWPFILMGIGGVFMLSALLMHTGGLAVPGSILLGLGGIFYYQTVTGDWESWSYMWALIPGFVGVGVIIAGLLSRNGPRFDSGGLVLLAISAMGFLLFGGIPGLNLNFNTLLPIFLIGIGVITLFSALFRKR